MDPSGWPLAFPGGYPNHPGMALPPFPPHAAPHHPMAAPAAAAAGAQQHGPGGHSGVHAGMPPGLPPGMMPPGTVPYGAIPGMEHAFAGMHPGLAYAIAAGHHPAALGHHPAAMAQSFGAAHAAALAGHPGAAGLMHSLGAAGLGGLGPGGAHLPGVPLSSGLGPGVMGGGGEGQPLPTEEEHAEQRARRLARNRASARVRRERLRSDVSDYETRVARLEEALQAVSCERLSKRWVCLKLVEASVRSF